MGTQQVTPAEAYEMVQRSHRYLDVRTEPEFANGHPAGAVNIPVVFLEAGTGHAEPNADFLDVVSAHFPKDTPLIIGCQSGVRSQRAADLLSGAGFSAVVNMRGGFGGARDQSGRTVVAGWKECGLPVCADCPPGSTYAALRSAARKG